MHLRLQDEVDINYSAKLGKKGMFSEALKKGNHGTLFKSIKFHLSCPDKCHFEV